MARSALLLVVAAAVVAGFDLGHKALAIAEQGGALPAHPRSALYVAGIALTAALWAGAIVLTRSASLALAGGVVSGGALGNLGSLALWPEIAGVPDPLRAGDLAFNVADVAVGAGVLLLLASAPAFALRNRDRLREPVRLRA